MAHDVPKVQYLNSFVLREDSIVDMKRRMNDTAYSRKTIDELAEARKVLKEIYVVEER